MSTPPEWGGFPESRVTALSSLGTATSCRPTPRGFPAASTTLAPYSRGSPAEAAPPPPHRGFRDYHLLPNIPPWVPGDTLRPTTIHPRVPDLRRDYRTLKKATPVVHLQHARSAGVT
ncbi:hypothetical protein M427DRAFT_55329 [Gonapodya prolifera JEL478]|uniref:Uncharacterized protein n=1 Tax=Gonapodya prolifera (strain JEL478) TaxID=1344416 RepID=A0A139AIP8_GONPJ|nr:hypothetical protein M427DRAFT_55329 [Gonapodya prolifera JEL478]|eukprot:KXS16681.1 hypothetical protein M427DRAFT_55329 [Gonapodya prolifera JEL478]